MVGAPRAIVGTAPTNLDDYLGRRDTTSELPDGERHKPTEHAASWLRTLAP